MNAQELIKEYRIRLGGGDRIEFWPKAGKRTITAKEREVIVANKPEILSILRAEVAAKEAEAAAYQAKLDGIEGLKELQAALNAEENYDYAFRRSMESEYPVRLPAKPAISSNELRAKYPRAAAYLRADSWTYASNVDKYSAGKAAREAILNGEDYEQALAEMEAKWTAAAEKARWN